MLTGKQNSTYTTFCKLVVFDASTVITSPHVQFRLQMTQIDLLLDIAIYEMDDGC